MRPSPSFPIGRPAVYWLLALAVMLLLPGRAAAQRGVAAPIYQQNLDALVDGAEEWLARLEEQGWLLRGQMTNTIQATPPFRSPYRGENSVSGKRDSTAMQTIDIVLGRRLWDGAEVIAVPSPTRGFGFADNHGLGGLTNTESFHGGTRNWDYNLTRLFIRQTIDVSHDAFGNDDDPMRFAGPLARERITITAGKLAVWDFFDNNSFAHEPRTQFLNYALVGAGAFDYASDAAGFTHGAVLEWENGRWATRLGGFQVARTQGGDFLDQNIGRGWQLLGELDRTWWLGRFPGALRLLLGASRTNAARYDDLTRAVQAGNDDTESLRRYRTKQMAAANWEQQFNDSWGAFARLGWNDGRSQNFMFTEMDWSASGGVSLNGWRWDRFNDTVGLAMNVGGLRGPQRRFLEAGGLGFILGDGRLNYAPEVVLEAFYDVGIAPGLNAALDLQLVANPGFNADRGPMPVATLRLRAAF